MYRYAGFELIEVKCNEECCIMLNRKITTQECDARKDS